MGRLATALMATLALALTSAPPLGGLAGAAAEEGDPRYANGGWSAEDRARWYRLSQGSRLVPYAWLRSFEAPDEDGALLLDRAYFSRFGYLWDDPQDPLPIGFVPDSRVEQNGAPWIGLTCAACHTSELNVGETRLRIDGGPAHSDFQSMMETLVAAGERTLAEPERFAAFADRVLGAEAGAAERATLRAELREWFDWRKLVLDANMPPIRYGYGRLDAIGHIFNKVRLSLDPEQPHDWPSDAPVSYPHVWNASQQPNLQWNGLVTKNEILTGQDIGALGRNVGQAIGVFGEIAFTRRPALSPTGIAGSSIDVQNLFDLERTLALLESPEWPEDLFGAIDREGPAYQTGKTLFMEHCAACHAHLEPDDVASVAPIALNPIFGEEPDAVGTDPWMACNAALHRSRTGPLKHRSVAFPAFVSARFGEEAPTAQLLGGAVKRVIAFNAGVIVRDAFSTRSLPEPPPRLAPEAAPADRKARLLLQCRDIAQQSDLIRYKARPLNGIWATAPYLHNGSVPTLWDLLLPASERPTSFRIPRDGAFDPGRVGLPADAQDGFLFRVEDEDGAPIPGNSNAGHEYGVGALDDAQREAILLYLKSL